MLAGLLSGLILLLAIPIVAPVLILLVAFIGAWLMPVLPVIMVFLSCWIVWKIASGVKWMLPKKGSVSFIPREKRKPIIVNWNGKKVPLGIVVSSMIFSIVLTIVLILVCLFLLLSLPLMVSVLIVVLIVTVRGMKRKK